MGHASKHARTNTHTHDQHTDTHTHTHTHRHTHTHARTRARARAHLGGVGRAHAGDHAVLYGAALQRLRKLFRDTGLEKL